MLATTYQHDFIPPHANRYEFLKENIADQTNYSQLGERKEKDAPKKSEKPIAMEWTGIAPMGRLIDPRVIPTTISPEQFKAIASDVQQECKEEQPNRFLKILRSVYPDLYERLQQMPKDELNRRLERQRMYTTYQTDFCNLNEYPEGLYESLKDQTNNTNTSKLLQAQQPCAEFRHNIMQELTKVSTDNKNKHKEGCEKVYKPFKISFGDSVRFINSGNNSHWRNSNIFSKKVSFSEYMDTINKIGCVIMKNNIHDHQNCMRKHCRHQLVHGCTKLK